MVESYCGLIASDTNIVNEPLSASNIIFNEANMSLKSLFGVDIDNDFNNIKEFIHLSFDPTAQDTIFNIIQQNYKYYIKLSFEESGNIYQSADILRNLGYKVELIKAKYCSSLFYSLTELTQLNKLNGLASYINSNLDSINQINHSGGSIIFYPTILDPKLEDNITKDIKYTLRNDKCIVLRYDCKPFKSFFISSGFMNPIFVSTNLSELSQKYIMDSVTTNYMNRIGKDTVNFIKTNL